MKKINNKFRSSGANNIYSLNYKFDSISSAGKFSGTALDLIKKYNELAKEAHSNGDYVEMEVFRQYAEHYRKIVTEINERKNTMRDSMQNQQEPETTAETVADEKNAENKPEETTAETAKDNVETSDKTENAPQPTVKKRLRRGFKIIEVSTENTDSPAEVLSEHTDADAPAEKPKRIIRRKPKIVEA